MSLKNISKIMLFTLVFALVSLLCMQLTENHMHSHHKNQTSSCITLHSSFLKSTSCSEKRTFFSLSFLFLFLPFYILKPTGSIRKVLNLNLFLLYLLIFSLVKKRFLSWLSFCQIQNAPPSAYFFAY